MKQKVTKTTFSNGIRVVSLKMPGIKSVSIGAWVRAGARYETSKENGLSHFIEHMLFKRTRNRTAYQLAREIAATGGYINAFTSMEYTCYYAKVMNVHVSTILSILADILFNCIFIQSEVNKERRIILQEVYSFENDPRELLGIMFRSVLWEGQPLGRSILGSLDTVRCFSEKDLVEFFRRFYRPGEIIISVAGAIEHEYLVDLIEPIFGCLEPSPSFVPIDHNSSSKIGSNVFVKDDATRQAHVCLGMLAPSVVDSNRFACSLMHTILGGNTSSRLFQQIREIMGLAYSAYSFLLSYKDTGAFSVYAAVDPTDVMLCIDAIMALFKQVALEKVSYDELESAKEYIRSNLLISAESTHSQMLRLAHSEFYFGNNVTIQSDIASFDSVTVEDIIYVASYVILHDSLSVVVLGPESLLKNQQFSGNLWY